MFDGNLRGRIRTPSSGSTGSDSGLFFRPDTGTAWRRLAPGTAAMKLLANDHDTVIAKDGSRLLISKGGHRRTARGAGSEGEAGGDGVGSGHDPGKGIGGTRWETQAVCAVNHRGGTGVSL
jgi:hypothetical protein